MARKDWQDLSPDYRARLERHGIGPFGRDRISMQRARGHKPREHLAKPKPEGGFTLSSTDRAFLARQSVRTTPEKFAKARAAYIAMSPDRRQTIRDVQAALAGAYRSNQRQRRRPARRARGGYNYDLVVGSCGEREVSRNFDWYAYEDIEEPEDWDDEVAILIYYK